MNNKQIASVKKEWTSPTVEELAIDQTLGGIVLAQTESFVVQTTGGPIVGSIPNPRL